MKVKSGYVKTMMHILINERMRVFLFRELKFLPQLLLPLKVWGGKQGTNGLRDALFNEFRRELKLDKEGLCGGGTRFGCQEDERKNWTEHFYNMTPWYYYLIAAVCVGKIYFKEEKDQSKNKSLKDIAMASAATANTLEDEGEKYLKKMWNKLWAEAIKPIHDLWKNLEAKGEIYGGYDQIIDSYTYDLDHQVTREKLFTYRHGEARYHYKVGLGTRSNRPWRNKMGYQNYLPMSFIRFAPQLYKSAMENYFTHAFPDLILWPDSVHRSFDIKYLNSVKNLQTWRPGATKGKFGDGWHPTKIADFALSLDQNNIPHLGLKSDKFWQSTGGLELSPAFYNSGVAAETLTPEYLFYTLTRGRSSDPTSLVKTSVLWPKDGTPHAGKKDKFGNYSISDAQNNIDPLSSFQLYAARYNAERNEAFVGGSGKPEGRWDKTKFADFQKPYNLREPVKNSYRGIDTSAAAAHELTFNAVSHLFNRYLTTVPGTFGKFLTTEINYSINFSGGSEMDWTLPAKEKDAEGFERDHGYLQTPTGGPSRDSTFFWQNAPGAYSWTNILHPENEIDAALANTIQGAGWIEPTMGTTPTIPTPPPEKCETDFLS